MVKQPTTVQWISMIPSGFFTVMNFVLFSVTGSAFVAFNAGFCLAVFIIAVLLWVMNVSLKPVQENEPVSQTIPSVAVPVLDALKRPVRPRKKKVV